MLHWFASVVHQQEASNNFNLIQEEKMSNSLLDLPKEVLEMVLMYIPPSFIDHRVMLVSKSFSTIISEEETFHQGYLENYFKLDEEKRTRLEKTFSNLKLHPSKRSFCSDYTMIFKKLIHVSKRRSECPKEHFRNKVLELTNEYFNTGQTYLLKEIEKLSKLEQAYAAQSCVKSGNFTVENEIQVHCKNLSENNLVFIDNYNEGLSTPMGLYYASKDMHCTVFLDNGFPIDIELDSWDGRYDAYINVCLNGGDDMFRIRRIEGGWDEEYTNVDAMYFIEHLFQLELESHEDLSSLDHDKLLVSILFTWICEVLKPVFDMDYVPSVFYTLSFEKGQIG